MTKKRFNDGRCCNNCGYLITTYIEWDCCGAWSSESECAMGYDLDETDGTQCEDYYYSGW